MEKILGKLFESAPKAKILTLFFRNPDSVFSFEEAGKHTRLKNRYVKKEIMQLYKLKILEKKSRIEIISGKNKRKKSKKTPVFSANPEFQLYKELRELFMKTAAASSKKLLTDILHLGKVKLAIVSGFFINHPISRVDLLIVGDNLDRRRLKNFLSRLESETGKTLSYSVMNSDEFRYRINMFDRFLRDILEFPHQKLINKFNI